MLAQSSPPADRLQLWTLSHDEALRAIVEELALQADHSIHWGPQALEHETPAAILVDLRHGGRSAGTVSALRCEPRLLQSPILVLVDDDDDAAVRDALGAGADDFLRRSWLERELPLRLLTQGKAALVRRELLSRERDLRTLVELTRSFAGALDRTSLLADVTSRLAGELGLRRCSVVLIQAGGQEACVAASSETDVQPNRIIDLSLYPEIRRALDRGTPVVVEDPRAHPLLDSVNEAMQASIPGGLAVLPLLWEGEALGVLILRANAIRSFTSRELDFATTVANATSVALRNVGSLEELQQTRNFQMIVELAGAAAHELNQPLTSILGWSELLIRKMEEQDPQYRPLSIIRREAERMAEVVRKLGRITRHETIEYVGETRILDLDKATGDG